ncbi:MAG: glycosyltransferase family 4 protein [Oryzomonas sp.]|uniref:glycosyltransferase family 4 protein n=1 Tax=Oryzomonas sp. TaxID=2855186 RepID=UPI002843BDF5|nr:glycosyltransferase family 4 protein [Oryzomonas sp.]MDR3580675.1 glycosyltransferase family 4 protein [Oryzomonas sp.]
MAEPLIRTLHLLPALDEGGVERSVINTAILEKSLNVLPTVVSCGGKMAIELTAAGIDHLTWPMASKNPLTIIRNAHHLANLIRERDIHIVHAHSRAPAWSGYLAGRLTKTPFVTTFAGAYSHQNWVKRWYNSSMTRGGALFVPSNFVRDHVATVYGVAVERITLMPLWLPPALPVSAIEKEEFRRRCGIPPECKLVTIIGRLTRLKGHELLIRAFSLVENRDARLLIIGTPKREGYETELKSLARRLEVADRVVFAGGGLDKARRAYSISDMVVSSSTKPEAFGLTMLEAASQGLPVVATAHGGALDLVIDRRTGFLVPPNDLAALATGISNVLRLSPEAYATMSAEARSHAASFTHDAVAPHLLEVYRRLLDKGERGAGR